jgi:integrase
MSCAGVPVCRRRAGPNKQKLTSLTVTKLRPTAKPFLVWDTMQRGLALLIQPSGHRSFKLVYRHHNRPRWFTIGAADAIALADARKLAAELMLRVIKGEDPAADKRAARGVGTFAELAERYLEQHAMKRNKSWRQGDASIRRHVLPHWGKLPAHSITRADVKAMMRRLDNTPITANQTLTAVSAVFTWAMREEILPSNPCKLVQGNPTRDRERILSASEIPAVWSAFDDAGPVVGTALKLILLLGQRPGEVSNLRYEHLRDGYWEMPGQPTPGIWPGTKNGCAHRVPLSKPAQELIADLEGEVSGYVFATVNGNAVSGLDGTMRSICRKLNIERATPHDLRRTFGSTVTALGFGRDAMDRLLNHKSHGVAAVYDRYSYEAEDQRIMEAVASKIMMLVRNTAPSNVVTAKF